MVVARAGAPTETRASMSFISQRWRRRRETGKPVSAPEYRVRSRRELAARARALLLPWARADFGGMRDARFEALGSHEGVAVLLSTAALDDDDAEREEREPAASDDPKTTTHRSHAEEDAVVRTGNATRVLESTRALVDTAMVISGLALTVSVPQLFVPLDDTLSLETLRTSVSMGNDDPSFDAPKHAWYGAWDAADFRHAAYWIECAFLGLALWHNVRSLMTGFLWITSLGVCMTTLESRLEFAIAHLKSIGSIWTFPATGLMCTCASLPFAAARVSPPATLAAIAPAAVVLFCVVDMHPKGEMMARTQHATAREMMRRRGELEREPGGGEKQKSRSSARSTIDVQRTLGS